MTFSFAGCGFGDSTESPECRNRNKSDGVADEFCLHLLAEVSLDADLHKNVDHLLRKLSHAKACSNAYWFQEALGSLDVSVRSYLTMVKQRHKSPTG